MTETETRSQAGEAEGSTGSRRKLTEEQEREVTRLYAETETPVSEISKRFGIGESSAYRVAQRHGASLRGRQSSGARWRVSVTATRVFTASSMSDAIRQAEAAGATDIVGITRND